MIEIEFHISMYRFPWMSENFNWKCSFFQYTPRIQNIFFDFVCFYNMNGMFNKLIKHKIGHLVGLIYWRPDCSIKKKARVHHYWSEYSNQYNCVYINYLNELSIQLKMDCYFEEFARVLRFRWYWRHYSDKVNNVVM